MKRYAIVIKNNKISESAYRKLQSSTSQKVMVFDAITPDEVQEKLKMFDLKWNYPWNQPVLDMQSGLKKSPYQTRNRDARIATALSHYVLWKMCITLDEPIVILEHDSYFIKEIDFDPSEAPFDIIGINNPIGATRLSRKFNNIVQASPDRFIRVPKIDDDTIPQGLAGNSAYIIKPAGAKKMIQLVKDYGLWPNDAIMCRQLVPKLGVTTRYYTKVQGTRSTTTL